MANLNLEQLRAFLSVARLGSISQAADALNLTQPAVSTRIKKLEETLGTKLLDRSASRTSLTKSGGVLVHYAEQIEQISEKISDEIVDTSDMKGLLRLGVSETIAQCWLPEFVAAIHHNYPGIQIEINVDISLNLRRYLTERKIDLALLLGPISEYSINNVELPGFELAWYRPVTFEKNTDPVAELFKMPVVTYARNTRPFRELKATLFEKFGPDVTLFPSSSLFACFRLVEAGLGIGALPRLIGMDWVAAGKIAKFDPGWTPAPLNFTASYLGEPKSYMIENAANLANNVAIKYTENKIYL